MKFGFELNALLSCQHPKGEVFSGISQYNRDLHLVHTISGQGRLRINDRVFQASSGQVFSVPPFTQTIWEKDAGSCWQMLNIHFRILRGDESSLGAILPVVFKPRGFSSIKAELQKSFRSLQKEDVDLQLKATARLMDLIAGYWRDFAIPIPKASLVSPALLRLHQDIIASAAREFDAFALARSLNMSISQMNRRFRQAFAVAPKELWLRHRLIAAQKHLAESDDTLETIAGRMGFSDQFYFSKWITSRLGIPPGEFRKREAKLRPKDGLSTF